MALFYFDVTELCYSDLQAAKRWWIETFDCRQVPIPPNWEDICPSDIALLTPEAKLPLILLSDKAEVDCDEAVVPIISCKKLEKAREYLSERGVIAGPLQDGGDCQFFEIRDSEGHVIEICTEP